MELELWRESFVNSDKYNAKNGYRTSAVVLMKQLNILGTKHEKKTCYN